MGRRSRKRGLAEPRGRPEHAEAVVPVPGAAAARRTYRARRSEAPPAPWAPVPLAEIAILIGLCLLVAGLLTDVGAPRGKALVGAGLFLICLSSLELALREHLAGYKSHTTLLAGTPGVLTLIVLSEITTLPRYVVLIVAAIIFGGLWRLLRVLFTRRSGLSFRA